MGANGGEVEIEGEPEIGVVTEGDTCKVDNQNSLIKMGQESANADKNRKITEQEMDEIYEDYLEKSNSESFVLGDYLQSLWKIYEKE
jgi:hypothetical protein